MLIVVVGRHFPMAEIIDIGTLKGEGGAAPGEFPHDPPFADAGGRIGGGMVEDGIGIEAGIAAAEHIVKLDVEDVFVTGGGVPDAFECDIDHVRGLPGDAEHTVGRLIVARAAIHAVIDGICGIDHLDAIKEIGGNLAAGLLDHGGDGTVR